MGQFLLKKKECKNQSKSFFKLSSPLPLFDFPFLKTFSEKITSQKKIYLDLKGSLKYILIEKYHSQTKRPIILVTSTSNFNQIENDLLSLGLNKNQIFFIEDKKGSTDLQVYRNTAIKNLSLGKRAVYICTPKSLSYLLPSKEKISSNQLHFYKNQKVEYSEFFTFFENHQFERVDFVEGVGQYAVRGKIIDFFTFGSQMPYRIVLNDDNIESIKSFEIESQLTQEEFQKIYISPKKIWEEEEEDGFEKYLSDDVVIWWMADASFYEKNIEKQISFDEVKQRCLKYSIVSEIKNLGNGFEELDYKSTNLPTFNKSIENFEKYVSQKIEDRYKVHLCIIEEKQKNRFKEILSKYREDIIFHNIVLAQGFEDTENKISVVSEHEILSKYKSFGNMRKIKTLKMAIKEIDQFKVGDLVVHTDFGIGKFAGLHTIDIQGEKKEVFRIVYNGGDFVNVSIHSLHKISKHSGESENAKLHTLGSSTWVNSKKKVKSRLKQLTFDLVKLYALRKSEKGFAFAQDNYMMHEMEASFIYEETPDQSKAIESVKSDMEKDTPMERLICGDVGFGKTEVAIRAVFKAACDNKQSAVLVPTTVLAYQHYIQFANRFEKFPIKVELLTRLKTAKQKKEIFEKIEKGEVDVVIGTHLLLNPKVKFKNIGLLVVDEEQKFGVSVKEKLKSLQQYIDTITMTATPIPRTLQMSLMGFRDMSIIRTPPLNRKPIYTEIIPFNLDMIVERIQQEINRKGQIFFVHNRISNLEELAAQFQMFMPKARIITAHGQMQPSKLEDRVLDFMNGKYDIILCTTIIENGIDIPNCNTVFINNAQNFGLSELHQLRGRVGRSDVEAFCYLIAPPIDTLTKESQKRLKVIQEFNEPGSGFLISMKDLEIRGAGDVLGAEQSGFIAEIGLQTYQHILQEALLESQFEQENKKEILSGLSENIVAECNLDLQREYSIPPEYIENMSERLYYYNEISKVQSLEDLNKIQFSLNDRFGDLPYSVLQLLEAMKIRWMGQKLGVNKIIIKNEVFILHFNHPKYLEESFFQKLMIWIQTNHRIAKIKKKATSESNDEKLFIEIIYNGKLETIESILEQIQNVAI